MNQNMEFNLSKHCYKLSHYCRENNLLSGFDRRFLYCMGRYLEYGYLLSIRQRNYLGNVLRMTKHLKPESF